MAVFGWIVLALVFVDELLAMAAFGIWGWRHDPRWVLVWLLPLAAMTVWYLLASPRAPYGGPLVRPVAKLLVFGLATHARRIDTRGPSNPHSWSAESTLVARR